MFDLSMFPEPVTPVTPRKNAGVTKNSFINNAVTRVTPVTRKKHNVRVDINPDEWQEAFEERAAIIEYDGGLSRQEAEQQARVICLAEFRRRR